MRAMNILNQTLCPKLQSIHKVRANAVFCIVDSLLRGGRLSLTALGRSCEKGTTQKHSIKRVDRLLGNKHLHAELPIFYRAIAHTFLKNCSRPLILIDWTRIEPEHIALVASVPLDGRSLPIYIEVHPLKKDNNIKVMKNFLNQLQRVLPENAEPIIVTDAGFRNTWFKAVENMGWDFVGRLRNTPYMCRTNEENWKKLKELHRFAQSKSHDLGMWTISKSNSTNARIIAYRKRKYLNKSKSVVCSVNLKNQSKNKEPWILATSLM